VDACSRSPTCGTKRRRCWYEEEDVLATVDPARLNGVVSVVSNAASTAPRMDGADARLDRRQPGVTSSQRSRPRGRPTTGSGGLRRVRTSARSEGGAAASA